MKRICSYAGKVIYQSKSDAMAGFRARLKVKSEYGVRIKRRVGKPKTKRIYYCAFCGGYHLTGWGWWPFGTKHYLAEQERKMKHCLPYKYTCLPCQQNKECYGRAAFKRRRVCCYRYNNIPPLTLSVEQCPVVSTNYSL